MVALRTDECESKTSSWGETRRRSHLTLYDATQAAAVAPVPSPARRRSPWRRWDSFFFGLAVVSVLLFFVMSFLGFLWHSVTSAYQSSFAPAAPVITRRVAPGDTLWRYAARYGDPNSYILDRVETIARDNHLSSDAPLVPGQIVHIAVHNPTVLAQIERTRHSRLASLPRS